MSDDLLEKNAAARALGLLKFLSDDKTHFEALGRFIAAFANAEGASHALARKLSGLTDGKARLLFSGMRFTDVIDRIRGMVSEERATKSPFSAETLTDIDSCLDQLGHIASRRHNLVHRGATYFSGALISSNAMIAKTITNIESEIIEEQALNDMQMDCGAIFLRFIYMAKDDPQDALWLSALRQRPWRYKPPQPNSKKQQRHERSESRKPQNRASRASRRREAMKKHEKS